MPNGAQSLSVGKAGCPRAQTDQTGTLLRLKTGTLF